MSSSLRFMLLGLALLLFGSAFSGIIALAVANIPLRVTPQAGALIGLIVPIAGLILAFIGFFKRDRA